MSNTTDRTESNLQKAAKLERRLAKLDARETEACKRAVTLARARIAKKRAALIEAAGTDVARLVVTE